MDGNLHHLYKHSELLWILMSNKVQTLALWSVDKPHKHYFCSLSPMILNSKRADLYVRVYIISKYEINFAGEKMEFSVKTEA